MNLTVKKSISLAAALCLTLLSFAGCGKEPSQTAGNDSPKDKGEIRNISAMVFDRGNTPEGQGTVSDNRWTKWINEQMAEKGIQVKFMPVPRSEDTTKIPVMMSSGTAADIMLLYQQDMVQQYFTDGGTYELTPYLKEGVDDLKAYLGEDVLDAGKNENGEQFAVPARRATTARSNSFIRKDWLDKLGLAVPTTPDELYNVLKAFKEQDPGGVGKENIVGYVDNGSNVKMSFLQKMDQLDYDVFYPYQTYGDPGYKEYMRYKNKIYNEGLMDPEFFTSKNFSQKEKELCVSGYLGYWEYDVNGNVDNLRGGLFQNLKQNVPDAEFISIPPFTNVNDGEQYSTNYPKNGAYNFIPKTAKDPQACMEYLNFLAGEGGMTIFHGFEGEHYNLEDGIPVVIDADKNAKEKDWTRHDLFLVGNQGYYKTEDEFIKATSKELPGYEDYVVNNYTYSAEGTRMYEPIYNSPTQVEQSANISKINDEYNVKAITCTPDQFDTVYAEWLKELEKYDIQKIIEERTAYFEKMSQ